MLFTTKYLIRNNISLYRYLINPYFAFKKVKFRSEDTTNFKKIYTRYQEQQQWRRIYIVFLIKT